MKKSKPHKPKHQQQGNDQKAHPDKDATGRDVYVEPGAQIDFVQGLRDEYHTANEDNATSNQKQLFWARLSVLLIAIYAALTLLMYIVNNRAAKAAEDAATQAKNANEATRAANRAYVSSLGITALQDTVMTPQGEKPRYDLSCGWENGGNTPATGVQYFNLASMTHEPDDAEFRGPVSQSEMASAAVMPHSRLGCTVLNKEPMFMLQAAHYMIAQVPNSPQVYGWGWVVYRDAFLNSEVHVTEFCSQVIGIQIQGLNILGSKKPKTNSITQFAWGNCKTHNCVDRNCKDYESMSRLAPQ